MGEVLDFPDVRGGDVIQRRLGETDLELAARVLAHGMARRADVFQIAVEARVHPARTSIADTQLMAAFTMAMEA